MKYLKKLPLLLVVLFYQVAFAYSQKADSSKWSVGINYSINHNFYTKKGSFKNSYYTYNQGQYFQDSIDRSRTTFFNISVDLHRYINTKISIYSGIDFSNKGYQTRDYIIQTSNTFGTQYPSPNNTTMEVQDVYNYYYLSIPLGFDYCFGTKKIYLTLGAGLSADILLGYNLNSKNLINSDNWINPPIPQNTFIHFPMRAIVLTGSVHGGICFKTTTGITWVLQPFFSSNLISAINKTKDNLDGSKLYFYTYGVSLGVLFK